MSQHVSRIFFLLLFLPLFSFGQDVAVVDTAAVEREVDSLSRLGMSLVNEGKFPDAFLTISNADSLYKLHFSENDSVYATILNILGYSQLFTGRYVEAEKSWLKSIEIWKNINKNSSVDYGVSCKNLANVYLRIGKLENAEKYLQEAKSVLLLQLGAESDYYTGVLNDLAILFYFRGQYDKCEPLMHQVAKSWRKILGENDPNYALSLNNLATVLNEMGKYDIGEKYLLESVRIRKSTLGETHPLYAQSLNNLAAYYSGAELATKIEQLYIESIRIQETFVGQMNDEYCLYVKNLAAHYRKLRLYDKADSLSQKALNIRREIFGEKHRDYFHSLNEYALLKVDQRRIKEADSLLTLLLEYREKHLGKSHPDYVQSLLNIGYLNILKNKFDLAEQYLLESLSISETLLGPLNNDYGLSLLYLCILHITMKNANKSAYYLTLYNNFVNKLIANKVLYASEIESAKYINKKYVEAKNLSASFCYIHKLVSFNNILYNSNLLAQSILLENRINIEQSVSKSDVTTQDIYSQWKGTYRLLYNEYTKANYKPKNLSALEEKVNLLEKQLVQSVAGFTESRRQFTWPEVRDRLSPTQAAIEFIHFRYYTPEPTDSTLYAALVLLPGDTAPHFIPLCEQRQVDAVVAGAQGDGGKIRIQDIYWPDTKSGSSLYSLIWAPLEPLLKGVKTVYFSPSGLLHRLNPGAIGKDKRTYLSDSIQFVQLGSTRQLVTGLNAGPQNVQTAVVFGGIHYEMDSTAIARANAGIPTDSTETRGSGMFKYADPAERTRGGGEKWDYLPETAVEADSIQQILNHAGVETSKYDGYKATEESFKQIGKLQPSPRILHLATHGFFFPDPQDTSAARRSTLTDEPIFKISEHPMIRSGLMLAGSKYAWDTGQALEGMEDGILTAYEISQMNLSNTELVVLSACETGLGDIQGNEGVYGLQRAFKIAGVKNIVMSLWKVPEAATRELMTAFYKKWLDDKLSVRDALREAQQYVRAQPRYNSPYYWAGFVLVE